MLLLLLLLLVVLVLASAASKSSSSSGDDKGDNDNYNQYVVQHYWDYIHYREKKNWMITVAHTKNVFGQQLGSEKAFKLAGKCGDWILM